MSQPGGQGPATQVLMTAELVPCQAARCASYMNLFMQLPHNHVTVSFKCSDIGAFHKKVVPS